MATTLDRVLHHRQRRVGVSQRTSYVASSVLIHLAIVGVALLLPNLFTKPPETFDYVAVTVVPPQALGVDEPVEAAEEPPPKPVEEPPPPAPKPEVEPPPPDEPVLVKQEKKPEPPPKKQAKAPPAVPPPPATPPPPANPMARRRGSALGNPLGASSSAALQGVEDPNFTYGYYLDRVVAVISRNWVRPPVGGDVQQTLLYFRIHSDGRISDLKIKETSDNATFDQAAIRAVEASSPLPPLPKSYKRDHLGLNLIVR